MKIPAGIFLSGPITLANYVNLQVDSGAILRMLPLDQYPGGTVNPANFATCALIAKWSRLAKREP